MPVELITEQFLIRSMCPQDVTERYVKWLTDPVVMAGISTPLAHLTVERAQKRIERRYDNATKFELGVFSRPNNDLLIGYATLDYQLFHRTVSMNTVIGDREFWGRNLLLELSEITMEFIFERMNAEKITGRAMARNFPTVFINKAMGMKVEAVLRGEWLMRDRSRADVLAFGLLREDWRERRRAGKIPSGTDIASGARK